MASSEVSRCGRRLRAAAKASNLNDKLTELRKVKQIFADSKHLDDLVDSYLEELILMCNTTEMPIRIFAIEFLEEISLREPKVLRKMTLNYLNLFRENKTNIPFMKLLLRSMTRIFPKMLRWCIEASEDPVADRVYRAFKHLVDQLLEMIVSDDEAIKTMTIKLHEIVVLCCSVSPDDTPSEDLSLNLVQEDHKFLSYRQLRDESVHHLGSMLSQITLSYISFQNFIVLLSSIMNIAERRPVHISSVISTIESLHVNLPSTLTAGQVKSVRKELKMHLIRLIKSPSVIGVHEQVARLLVELGASKSSVDRATNEVQQMIRKRKKEEEERDRIEAPAKRFCPDTVDDLGEDLAKNPQAFDKIANEISTNFIVERLSHQVAANLVMISIMTLPDKMPAAFASSYTEIPNDSSEQMKEQRLRIAKMMATQFTQAEIGPGVEQLFMSGWKLINEKQRAPAATPAQKPSTSETSKVSAVAKPIRLAPVKEFDIVKQCRELKTEEMSNICRLAFGAILNSEPDSHHVGRQSECHALIAKLVARFRLPSHGIDMSEVVINFILADHRARAEIAVLWIFEMYAQYQGFSVWYASNREHGLLSRDERYAEYDNVLTRLISRFYDEGLVQEMAFHRLFLEIPLITPRALQLLKRACFNDMYGPLCLVTLREMIIARHRQRPDFVRLLFEIILYCPAIANSEQAVLTVKELYALDYVSPTLADFLKQHLNNCLKDSPPIEFSQPGRPAITVWTDDLYNKVLLLYVDLIPCDPSLLMQLTKTYAESPNSSFKKLVLFHIRPALQNLKLESPCIIECVKQCPPGAESLIARIILLLSDKDHMTMEIVNAMLELHEKRDTDVRSLIPILSGLPVDKIEELLPKLIFITSNQKATMHVLNRILLSRHPISKKPPVSPVDFILMYHHMEVENEEQRKLHQLHLNLVFNCMLMTQHIITAAIERLLQEDPLSDLFYTTLVIVRTKFPQLETFVSNIVAKMIEHKLWKRKPEHRILFYKMLLRLGTMAYLPILTALSGDEFLDFVKTIGHDKQSILARLKAYLPQLSLHQQRVVSKTTKELLDENPTAIKEPKTVATKASEQG